MDLSKHANYACPLSDLTPEIVGKYYGGWISPDGDVLWVKSCGHAGLAMELVEAGIVRDDGRSSYGPMFRHGWVRWYSGNNRNEVTFEWRNYQDTLNYAPEPVVEAIAKVAVRLNGEGVRVGLDFTSLEDSWTNLEGFHPSAKARLAGWVVKVTPQVPELVAAAA